MTSKYTVVNAFYRNYCYYFEKVMFETTSRVKIGYYSFELTMLPIFKFDFSIVFISTNRIIDISLHFAYVFTLVRPTPIGIISTSGQQKHFSFCTDTLKVNKRLLVGVALLKIFLQFRFCEI